MLNIDVGITLCAIGATDTEGASGVKQKLSSVKWDHPDLAAMVVYTLSHSHHSLNSHQMSSVPLLFTHINLFTSLHLI